MTDDVSYLDLTDESFEAWPEEAKGWATMKLTGFRAQPKGDRTWFLLQFAGENGARASLSQNLFAHPADEGKKTGNRITLGKLKQFFTAAGLTADELPAPNPRAIAQALAAMDGKDVTVDAYLASDSRGYTEATKFRKPKVKDAATEDEPPF